MGVFAFSCGVILLYRLSMLPPSRWLVASFITALYAFIISRSSPFRYGSVCLVGLVLGLGWAAWHAEDRLSERLPVVLEAAPLSVSGYVCDVPSNGSFQSLRFSFCVTRWHGIAEAAEPGRRLPALLKLAWYGRNGAGLPAHRLRLEVVLKRPHGSLNPAGFRYEDWLFRKGYRATGTVREVEADPTVPCNWQCRYRQAHRELVTGLERRFAGAGHFPLIASLLVGYRGFLTEGQWQVLKATGTIHLVAISGLHLGLIALGAGFLCRRLLLALPVGFLSERNYRRLVYGTVVVCCLVYALVAGFTVPTRRALIMVVVGGWSLLLARQVPPWHAFLLALAGVLLLDPFAPLDQGFWLSFGAVLVLLLVFAGAHGRRGWVAGLLVSQCAIFAGLWPLLMVFGQGQPVAGALANLVAIPWVSAVVMPVLVAGGILGAAVPAASGWVIPAFDLVLGTLWQALTWLAEAPFPKPQPSFAELLLLPAVVLSLLCLPFRGLRLAGFAVLVGWCLTLSGEHVGSNPEISGTDMRVWDVGQGLSVLVRSGGEVLLYDTGPAVKGVFSAVESTLLPNLRALGVRRIDTLVVSHADSDHAGGLALLAGAVDIGRIVTGEPEAIRELLDGAGHPPVTACVPGEAAMGRLALSYWRFAKASEGNDASCVLSIQDPVSRTEWILPGDITSRAERAYVREVASKTARAPVKTRVVVAPHHGSKTSSSAAWVGALVPDIIIYSAGYRHRFGHPDKGVADRYRRAGALAFNTACSGMLLLEAKPNHLNIKEMRHRSPFWTGGKGLARDQCKIP